MNDLQFMPHQEEVLNLTDDKNRCAYYLDMGLGKTFVGAEKIYLLNNTVNLIVCQKSKVDDWVDHMKTYYPEYKVILNKALVDYMVKKIPVEQTINQCDDLIMFQKIVKLSNNYNWVEHEHGTGQIIKTTKHRDGTRTEVWSYPTTQKYTYKSYRVFASNRVTDGRLLRRKVVKPKGEKFGNTPDHSFIYNDSVIGVKVPPELDKQWYIDLARKRLKQFGIAA